MIEIYFGLPGCGKTTLACKFSKEYLAKGKSVFADLSVCPVKGVTDIDCKQLGIVTPPPKSLLIVDEAGIEFNNRMYKSLNKSVIQWFKLARHYDVDIVIFSQSYEDMDITIRRLATRLWHIKRMGPFSFVRRIDHFIGIDDTTKQIIDQYKFAPLLAKLLRLPVLRSLFCPVSPWYFVFRPLYYKDFDSYIAPSLPYPPTYKGKVEVKKSWCASVGEYISSSVQHIKNWVVAHL